MKSVYIIVGDLGSARELLLAEKEIISRDARIKWFVSAGGKAGDLLTKDKIVFRGRGPDASDCPDLLLIGTGATAYQAQIEWTKWGRANNVPVLWLEDLWGCGEHSVVRGVSPDAMLVNDGVAAEIARTIRPDLETVAVGKATFEPLAEVEKNATEIRRRVRKELGVNMADFLVLYSSGGSPDRAAEHLQALAKIPNQSYGLRHNFVFAPRLHPKLPDDKKPHLSKFVARGDKRAVDACRIPLEELIVSSEAVVADWGCTEGYKSVLLKVPTIVTLFPDDANDAERRTDVGYPGGIPPLIKTGSAIAVRSAEDLRDGLWEISHLYWAVIQAMAKNREPYIHLLRPGASARVADAVMKRIK